MRHGSLESGIGMFDYAAEQMEWENVFHCEINPFCRTILNYYWPKSKSYANVFGFNGYEWRRKVDIITGGFPCQPFSNAGKRDGSKDDRHIWPENLRIVREAQPPFCLFENVPGLITIEGGMVFEQVCADLENEGYEVLPVIIPACATDKDHRRDRVWIIAYNHGVSKEQRECKIRGVWDESNAAGQFDASDHTSEGLSQPVQTRIKQLQTEAGRRLHDRLEQCNRNATNALCIGQQGPGEYRRPGNTEENGDRQIDRTFNGNQLKESWVEAATRLCSVDDGYTGRLDTDAISKVYGKRIRNYKSKWRTESLKAYGNTIIWEIAYEIFKAIEQFNQNNELLKS